MRARLLFLLFFVVTGPAFAEPVTLKLAGRDVMAWLPAQQKGAPVIIFSHGFHGCNTQSTFLMEALANSGYAVFAPNHKDAACGDMRGWLERGQEPFRDASQWTDETYRDRAEDIEMVLDALEDDDTFNMLDFDHIGIAGHSLGGYTAIGVAGGWDSWKDKRIKAVLAMSAYVAPFITPWSIEWLGSTDYLDEVEVPVMYMGGTRDRLVTPLITDKKGAYARTNSPKAYVELEGANHFAWTDRQDKYHATINAYAVAFFDNALRKEPFPEALTKQQPDTSKVWINLY